MAPVARVCHVTWWSLRPDLGVCTQRRRPFSLSAPGGGEGRGEVGVTVFSLDPLQRHLCPASRNSSVSALTAALGWHKRAPAWSPEATRCGPGGNRRGPFHSDLTLDPRQDAHHRPNSGQKGGSVGQRRPSASRRLSSASRARRLCAQASHLDDRASTAAKPATLRSLFRLATNAEPLTYSVDRTGAMCISGPAPRRRQAGSGAGSGAGDT